MDWIAVKDYNFPPALIWVGLQHGGFDNFCGSIHDLNLEVQTPL
jgi:hypothetical protein